MGDFNAGCTYFTASDMVTNRLKNDPRFLWLIGDDADSTTKSTVCAYDRFVVGGAYLQAHSKNPTIFNFQAAYGLDQNVVSRFWLHW